MRIALFHNLPSGGAKRALYEWTSRLTGHDLALYTPSSADEEFLDLRPLVSKAVRYPCSMPMHQRPLSPLGLLLRFVDLWSVSRLHRRIAAEIDRTQPDIVFVNPCWYTQAPFVLRYLSRPVVYFCQEPPRWLVESLPSRSTPAATGFSPAYRAARTLFRWTFKRHLAEVDRENVRNSDVLLVNSHFSREATYRTYGRLARVNRLGVDARLFHPSEVDKANRVLSVGALAPVKGHDFVLKAIGRIPKERRPKFDIVADRGTPAERAYLQKLADEVGVNVHFHVGIADSDLVTLYNSARVTACASIMEPFGLVPLESMACGTPVVAVREGGLRETVLDGQTGRLTERDHEEFAYAIDEMLADEGERRRLGQQARDYVSREWTWEESTTCLERHLARAANRAPEEEN